ncbi:MAG: flippase [Candidatus Methanoperedens sp.]|nr:flippase [Candidatus Methanoperedens sp.]
MSKLNTVFSRIMDVEPVRRQSLANFILQIAFTFVGFFSTVYFAHAVGANVLGQYFLALAYLGIIGMVTDGGFGGAAIKRISEGEEPDAYFSAFFILRSLFVTIVVIALIIFRGYFVDLNSTGIFIWLLLAMVVSHFRGVVEAGVVGCAKVGISATIGFIDNLLRIIIQVIAVFLGFSVAGLMGGFIGGMLAAVIIELRFLDLRLVRFDMRHIKSLSTFSFWLFLTSSGLLVFSYADTIMIGYFLENRDVGVYKIVLQFSSFAGFTVTSLHSTLWPRVSRWGKTGEIVPIEKSLSRACSYSLILALPILSGGVLLGDRLLYFLYGQEFTYGYTALTILLVMQVVNIFQFFFTMYLGALDCQKEAFKVTIVAVFANIILNYLLIPVLGISGAALATISTMLLNAVLARRVLSKKMNIRLEYNTLLNILKAAVAMSLFVGAYRLFVPLSSVWLTLIPVILGGMLYGVLILKFDRKIYDELKGIFAQMNVTWPTWLS